MRIIQSAKAYAHLAPTLALFGGFVFDIFTLNRPDALFENITILGYLTISAGAILLLQTSGILYNERKRVLMLSVLQFSFGNLASALMVLYARSGTLAGSAIFIAMLAALFLGNEVLKDRYARNTLRVSLWFFLLLTYSALIVPVLLHQIGLAVFLLSVALALTVMYLFLRLLTLILRVSFREYIAHLRIIIVAIAAIFVLLYLANFIPPVPLATKHIGIYHNVTKLDDAYVLEYEPARWFMFWRDTNTIVHVVPGMPVYCFSAIFAPGDLQTTIYHSWDKFNPERKTWETITRTSFPILGGRVKGYRGYTYLVQLEEGQWRCRTETKRGAALGQTTFSVSLVETKPYTQIEKF